MRQLPMFCKRRIIHPLRVNEEQPPVPHRPENVKIQAPHLRPRTQQPEPRHPPRPPSLALCRAILHSAAKERSATPFLSTTSALFAKTPGCHQERSFNSSTNSLALRKSFRIRTYSRSPRF